MSSLFIFPSLHFVNPHQVDNMEYMLFTAKLQDCYNTTPAARTDDLNVYCPVIGQACVARFDDKLWYRAQVIGECVCMWMAQF